jgi:hypothetical protein
MHFHAWLLGVSCDENYHFLKKIKNSRQISCENNVQVWILLIIHHICTFQNNKIEYVFNLIWCSEFDFPLLCDIWHVSPWEHAFCPHSTSHQPHTRRVPLFVPF